MRPFPIYLVDDDESVRESLSLLLKTLDYDVHAYACGDDFLQQAELNEVGCVILDSRMPKLNGQAVQQHLIKQHASLGIIFLTGHGDVPMAVDALQKGAVDFLQKPVSLDKLIPAIDKARQVSFQAKEKQHANLLFDTLTDREKSILSLIISGKKNQQIADELCLSVRTVEVHKSSLMKKFQAKTVAQLVILYMQIESTGKDK